MAVIFLFLLGFNSLLGKRISSFLQNSNNNNNNLGYSTDVDWYQVINNPSLTF